MSSSFERFLAGEDRLAALLRALPAFEPPASLEAGFAAAAQAAQETVGAAIGREFAINDRSNEKTPPHAGFEPPASLEASFLKMAASIDSAQTPRREAVLAQIARGDSPQAALGADLQPATAEWLRQQADSAAPAKPEKPAREAVFLGFSWFDLRVAALAVFLSAVATQLVLKHSPDPQQLALQELFQKALEPRPAASEAQLAEASERSLADAQQALDAAHATSQKQELAKERRSAAGAAPAEAAADKLAKRAEAAEPEAEIGPPAHLLAPAQTTNFGSGTSGQQLPEPISAPPAPTAAPMAALPTGMPEKSASGAAPAMAYRESPAPKRDRALGEQLADAAPAPVTRRAEAELKAAPAPAPIASAAPRVASPMVAPPPPPQEETLERLAGTHDVFTSDLNEDPARLVARLPQRPGGQIWLLYTAEPPQNAELKRWLEALYQRIPKASRPGGIQLVPAKLPPRQLRLVLPPAAEPATR